jgi:hypothetical protein
VAGLRAIAAKQADSQCESETKGTSWHTLAGHLLTLTYMPFTFVQPGTDSDVGGGNSLSLTAAAPTPAERGGSKLNRILATLSPFKRRRQPHPVIPSTEDDDGSALKRLRSLSKTVSSSGVALAEAASSGRAGSLVEAPHAPDAPQQSVPAAAPLPSANES